MAFYFALMNVSNVNLDRQHKRRSSSLSRYHQHHQAQRHPRRTTVAFHDADVSARTRELKNIVSPALRIRHKLLEAPNDRKPSNDASEKKVTFEKRKSKDTVTTDYSFSTNQAFLDEQEVKVSSGANCVKKDIVMQPAHLAMVPQHVDVSVCKQQNALKKTLPIWKTSSSTRSIADTQLLAKKRMSNSAAEEKINEGYYPGSALCSDHGQQAHVEALVPSTIQNVANELIEHKQLLSAPPRRRRFWKPTTLLRRRSTSDNYSKYTWSYFNPGFRFMEEEYGACGGALRADENCNFLTSYIYSERLPLTEDFWRTR